MAQKRMFSKQIVSSDAFMDMPQSTQLLYFHLSMEADDDGFIGNPKKIMRGVGSSEDDYKILIAKRFILVFPEGICVIKHWLIHNYIQSDRYKETKYLKQKQLLGTKENKAYTEIEKIGKEKQIAGKKEIAFDIPEWLDKEVWDAWVKHRIDKKKPLTLKAMQLSIKVLEKDKAHAQEIIEASIMGGWTGLFEYKGGSKVTENKGGIQL